jgi:pimeloyl-ACP methyl ester carboxylesterase
LFIVEPIWSLDMTITREKVIRLALGQGGRLFPALAGKLAFDLFCRTADPLKPGKGEAAAISRAAPLMADAHTVRVQTSLGHVAVHWFAASAPLKGRALVLHGWRSRTDFMVRLVRSLTEEGWAVAAIDLPGHGQSSGRALNVKLGVEAVAIVNESFGPFDLAVGHSFGGVVAVNATVGGIKAFEPVPFKKIAIIASPNSMPDLFRSVGKRLGLKPIAQAAFEARVEAVAGHRLETYVMSEQLRRFNGAVLVLHAPDDAEVPYADALAMESAGGHVRLAPMHGLGHRRIIADERVFAELRVFGRTESGTAAEAEPA